MRNPQGRCKIAKALIESWISPEMSASEMRSGRIFSGDGPNLASETWVSDQPTRLCTPRLDSKSPATNREPLSSRQSLPASNTLELPAWQELPASPHLAGGTPYFIHIHK